MSNNSTAVSNVIPFRFEAKEVRTLLIDDQPWFVAKDVIASLEYAKASNPARVVDHVPAQWKGVNPIHTLGGSQQVLMLTEQGLYFFIGRSDKPKALPFQMWLAGDVLPEIRKHGRYEDGEGKMGTLIGQTIGTDGFHMLGAVVKGKVSSLPTHAQRRATAKIWSQTHAAFGVRSAADIPSDQLDAARNFIAAYVVLEGEYIQAAPKGGVSLDKYEASHLYGLMSYFHAMSEHREHMLSAARLLDSKTLMLFFDMLNEGRGAFASLDKRRDELYQNSRSLGLNGGYASRASA